MLSTSIEMCLENLRDAEQKQGIGEAELRASAAGGLIICVLGTIWCKKHLVLKDNNVDPWMLNGTRKWFASTKPDNLPEIRPTLHLWRATRLGDAFFAMLKGKCLNIDALRKRFRTSSTHACFAELEVGRFLLSREFDVSYVEESGVRGKDFDIIATQNEMSISIEVNFKKDGPFKASSIENTLRSKRDQVPDTRPAILFMEIPQSWAPDTSEMIRLYDQAIAKVWRGSGRWSALILQWERIIRREDDAVYRREFRACYNEMARKPFDRRLFEGLSHLQHPASRSFYDALTDHRRRLRDAGQLPEGLMPGPFALH